jgi:hypothetical protein
MLNFPLILHYITQSVHKEISLQHISDLFLLLLLTVALPYSHFFHTTLRSSDAGSTKQANFEKRIPRAGSGFTLTEATPQHCPAYFPFRLLA